MERPLWNVKTSKYKWMHVQKEPDSADAENNQRLPLGRGKRGGKTRGRDRRGTDYCTETRWTAKADCTVRGSSSHSPAITVNGVWSVENVSLLAAHLVLIHTGVSYTSIKKNKDFLDFLGNPVFKTLPSNSGHWLNPLVRELRPHMPLCSMGKNLKTKALLRYCWEKRGWFLNVSGIAPSLFITIRQQLQCTQIYVCVKKKWKY